MRRWREDTTPIIVECPRTGRRLALPRDEALRVLTGRPSRAARDAVVMAVIAAGVMLAALMGGW